MTDLYMVVMWLCQFPTLRHYDIFPLSGNMTGGNILVGHGFDVEYEDCNDDYEDCDDSYDGCEWLAPA